MLLAYRQLAKEPKVLKALAATAFAVAVVEVPAGCFERWTTGSQFVVIGYVVTLRTRGVAWIGCVLFAAFGVFFMPDHSENRKLTSLFQRKFSESYTILESHMYQREYSANILLIALACSGKSVHCKSSSP